ncbi:MAG TPA: hydrolase TatD [Cytophagales bacterium]|jgi:TatD DNase family protein|nr:hydrolase TatD [Cytophagales bacterium]
MQLIETHAHIYSTKFDDDRDNIISRARDVGISQIIMPNIDHGSIEGMLKLETQYPKLCLPTMGLHPCSVDKDFEKELQTVKAWLDKRKFTAIGEIGTDLYWDKTKYDYQVEAFNQQVNWAKKYRLPIIIHCRESIDQTIELVERLADENLTGVFHCFTGDENHAQRIIDLGFYLGIGGVVTFNNGGLAEIMHKIPMERIILETDSPYLAPKPYRGKRNEPAYVIEVAKKIAELKQHTIEDVAQITTLNAQKLFNLNG